jgi:hypothetical protein
VTNSFLCVIIEVFKFVFAITICVCVSL